MVEPGEDPDDGARREPREEAGVDVELGVLLGVVGGPDFVVRYPNGDEVADVSAVWEATIIAGEPAGGYDEVTAVRGFALAELAAADLGPVGRATLRAVGLYGPEP